LNASVHPIIELDEARKPADTPALGDVAALATFLDPTATNDAFFGANVGLRVDVDTFMRVTILEAFFQNTDNFLLSSSNYLLYHDWVGNSMDARWWFVQYDYEYIFRNTTCPNNDVLCLRDFSKAIQPLTQRIFSSPENDAQWKKLFRGLLLWLFPINAPTDDARVTPFERFKALTQLLSPCISMDKMLQVSTGSDGQWYNDYAPLIASMFAQRVTDARAQLGDGPAEIPSGPGITTGGGGTEPEQINGVATTAAFHGLSWLMAVCFVLYFNC
jgi:hypothetical protein